MYDFNSAFQFVVEVPLDDLHNVVNFLTQSDETYQFGSSFAITSNGYREGYRSVYLSPASLRRLQSEDAVYLGLGRIKYAS